jgi:hypothetical protein
MVSGYSYVLRWNVQFIPKAPKSRSESETQANACNSWSWQKYACVSLSRFMVSTKLMQIKIHCLRRASPLPPQQSKGWHCMRLLRLQRGALCADTRSAAFWSLEAACLEKWQACRRCQDTTSAKERSRSNHGGGFAYSHSCLF